MTSARATADHAVMRSLNRSLVLDQLRSHGTASRASLADGTGLAKPTVSLIVEDLLTEGLVEEVGTGEATSSGGRPPILLRFNRRSSYLVGAHVGVRRTSIVLADALGDEVARAEFATPRGAGRQAGRVAVRRIGRAVRALLEEHSVPPQAVTAAGICLPGLVAAGEGELLLAPNLGWQHVAVVPLLLETTGVPFSAHNASQTTLVAEAREGAALGETDVLLIYAGSGVGAAALSGGRLLVGEQGLAGEIGHCRVDGDLPCGCGGHGCLETVASSAAVVAAVARRWGREVVSFDEVVAAAAEGDDAAASELDKAARLMGRAASWLVNVLAPRTVVVAGGMTVVGEPFLEAFRSAVLDGTLPALGSRLRVVPSLLGQDAEVRGVLLLARERAFAGPRVISSG